MSVSDSWGRGDSGRGSPERGASERRLTELADRLAEARRAGDPAPEELERLVDLLAKSDIDPGDRLTRALEGFARWSEAGLPDDARRERPHHASARDHERRFSERRADDRRNEDRAGSDPRPAPARPQTSRDTAPRDTAPRFAEPARDPGAGAYGERRERAPQPPLPQRPSVPRPSQAPAAAPPIASLRAALAEIAERQKALDSEGLRSPRERVAEQGARQRPSELASARESYSRAVAGSRPAASEATAEPAARPAVQYPEPESRRPEPAPRAPSRSYAPPPAPERSYAPPPPPAPDPVPPAVLRELKSEIDRLGNSVADLPTRAEIDRMTREMSDLAKRLTEDRPARLDRDSLSAIDKLVTEVDRMRSDAASPQMIAKLAEELHAISARLDALGPRNSNAIDALARRIEDIRGELDHFPRLSAVDGVASEIQTLIARLDAQEAAAAPTRDAVVGLAGRVQLLDGRIAAIAEATVASEEALERINATIRTELDSLPRAEAVTDLGRQIDALTEGLRSRSAIGPALKAVEGLTGKVEALDDKIEAFAARRAEDASWLTDAVRDEIAAANRPDAFDGLSRQIEALTQRMAVERNEPVVVDLNALSSQIELLGDRLASERRDDDGARIEGITSRIEDLGDRFDTMAAATRARGAAFEQVEESIRAIADQLLATRAPSAEASDALQSEIVRVVEGLTHNTDRIDDLHDAFSGLAARIERSCADLGTHAVETAISAARDALGASTPDGRALENELAEALSEMRASSAQSERRAADTLDAVRSTLERLLDRMENQPAPAYADLTEPRRQFGRDSEPPVENATEIARAAARRAMEEIADAEPATFGRASRVDDSPKFRADFGDFGPDDPIEPGAALPRPDVQPTSPAAPSAASLIASARRAKLQSNEPTPEPELHDEPERGSSLLAGVLATLKQRKRPILLGVAAVLIVFSALYVASGMTGEPEPAPQATPAPQSRLAPTEHWAVAPARAPEQSAPEQSAAEEAPAENEALNATALPDEPEPEAQPAEVASARPEAPAKATADSAPANPSTTAALAAPKAPARDLTNFAFAEAGSAAKARADWKTAEPASTGSIGRDPNALPDTIGGPTLKSRAKSGDPAAELEVGDRLLDGRNVPADPAAAARWFEKAAAQGSAPAQHRLGSLYEKGRGVGRDVAAARRWYEQAAASGNVRAMHNLGVVHAEGGLGKPDYAAAMVWFRMAAERGLNDSGYNLAVLAARGLGGKRDLIEAYKWFALAAADGDEDAAKKRDEVGKALGSSVTVAKAAVTDFKPKPVDPAANDPQVPPGGWDRVAAARS